MMPASLRPLARLLLSFLLALIPTVALAARPGAKAARRKAPEPVQVKGTRVSLSPPEGFTEAPRFQGFQQEATSASIMVTELPGPFEETVKGFTPESLASRDMKLLSRKLVKVGGHPGVLLHLTQTAGDVAWLKWVLVLGDPSATLLVAATWREQDSKTLSRSLESAVRSTRWEREAAPTPAPERFTLKALPGLKEAHRLQNTIMYTRDGTMPAGPVEGPLFIVAPSLGTASVGDDLEAFNLARLRATPDVSDLSVESSAALTVDGLKGHEAVARARHPATQKDFLLYQALLVEGDHYYVFQGRAGEADRAAYLEHFKAAVRGFQRAAATP